MTEEERAERAIAEQKIEEQWRKQTVVMAAIALYSHAEGRAKILAEQEGYTHYLRTEARRIAVDEAIEFLIEIERRSQKPEWGKR